MNINIESETGQIKKENKLTFTIYSEERNIVLKRIEDQIKQLILTEASVAENHIKKSNYNIKRTASYMNHNVVAIDGHTNETLRRASRLPTRSSFISAMHSTIQLPNCKAVATHHDQFQIPISKNRSNLHSAKYKEIDCERNLAIERKKREMELIERLCPKTTPKFPYTARPSSMSKTHHSIHSRPRG